MKMTAMTVATAVRVLIVMMTMIIKVDFFGGSMEDLPYYDPKATVSSEELQQQQIMLQQQLQMYRQQAQQEMEKIKKKENFQQLGWKTFDPVVPTYSEATINHPASPPNVSNTQQQQQQQLQQLIPPQQPVSLTSVSSEQSQQIQLMKQQQQQQQQLALNQMQQNTLQALQPVPQIQQKSVPLENKSVNQEEKKDTQPGNTTQIFEPFKEKSNNNAEPFQPFDSPQHKPASTSPSQTFQPFAEKNSEEQSNDSVNQVFSPFEDKDKKKNNQQLQTATNLSPQSFAEKNPKNANPSATQHNEFEGSSNIQKNLISQPNPTPQNEEDELKEFLEYCGLMRYFDIFLEEEVDLESLQEFTEEEMREMGVKRGAAKKILRCLQSYEPEKKTKTIKAPEKSIFIVTKNIQPDLSIDPNFSIIQNDVKPPQNRN